MKILIVEDEEMIADIISAGLTRTGYQCECVYDGAEAAGLLEEKRYDLILLDIMLPGADGYELMEYIKNYNTPVIFITARRGDLSWEQMTISPNRLSWQS